MVPPRTPAFRGRHMGPATASVDQATADLMRLGTDAEVLEPSELRSRIAETARRLADLYY